MSEIMAALFLDHNFRSRMKIITIITITITSYLNCNYSQCVVVLRNNKTFNGTF